MRRLGYKGTGSELSQGVQGDINAEATQIESDAQQLKTRLIKWCRAYLKEVFSMYVHLKAMRVFIESVLRYGLPAHGPDRTFSICLINMDRRKESQAKAVSEQEI